MRLTVLCAAILVLILGFSPAFVEAGQGGAPPAKAGAAPKGPKAQTAGPKSGAQAGKPASAGKAASGKKASAATGKPAASGKKASAGNGTSANASGKTNAPGQAKRGAAAPTDGATPEPTQAGANVPKNPKLQERLQAMLPPGMSLEEAAEGFRNKGQFVASLHVSQNLGIPFEDMKFQMVDQQASLGQAIQSLKPGADADVEAQRAQAQARRDLGE